MRQKLNAGGHIPTLEQTEVQGQICRRVLFVCKIMLMELYKLVDYNRRNEKSEGGTPGPWKKSFGEEFCSKFVEMNWKNNKGCLEFAELH